MRKLVVVLIVLFATALVGCGPPVIDSSFVGTGPRLIVAGDSIVSIGANEFHAALNLNYATMVRGYPGYKVADLLAKAPTLASYSPTIVVLDIGTNDVLYGTADASSILAQYQQLVAQFPSSCVVAVNLFEQPSVDQWRSDVASEINASLPSLATVILDWNAAVETDPSLVGAHDVHPSADGYVRLAQLVKTAADQCSAQPQKIWIATHR